MSLRIVPWYAAILAVLFVVLSLRVIQARRTQQVSLGEASDGDLQRRVRVHANFAEYTPFALLLLAMAELRGAPSALLHLLGLCLVLGRLAHAWGVSQPAEDYRFRVAGMGATFTAIPGGAVLAVVGW